MSVKKVEAGWLVDIQPGGRSGRRISKKLKTKAEALQWEAWAKANALKTPGWAPEKTDFRTVSSMVDLWWKAHGHVLNAGEDMKKRVIAALKAMGDPTPSQLTPTLFTTYRAKRTASGIEIPTVNREHAYLRSVINELLRLKEWRLENPMSQVRALPHDADELAYLDEKQVDQLLSELAVSANRHALPVSKLCLATGLRWGEAEQMTRRQLTKNKVSVVGKNRKVRSLPIEPRLAQELMDHHNQDETGERLFASCYAAFESAVGRCDFELPDGQLSHVLRHTFASDFMQRGGSILTLQRALDHQDLKTTMRYAHLSPDHLDQVLQFNPLARLYKEPDQQQGD